MSYAASQPRPQFLLLLDKISGESTDTLIKPFREVSVEELEDARPEISSLMTINGHNFIQPTDSTGSIDELIQNQTAFSKVKLVRHQILNAILDFANSPIHSAIQIVKERLWRRGVIILTDRITEMSSVENYRLHFYKADIYPCQPITPCFIFVKNQLFFVNTDNKKIPIPEILDAPVLKKLATRELAESDSIKLIETYSETLLKNDCLCFLSQLKFTLTLSIKKNKDDFVLVPLEVQLQFNHLKSSWRIIRCSLHHSAHQRRDSLDFLDQLSPVDTLTTLFNIKTMIPAGLRNGMYFSTVANSYRSPPASPCRQAAMADMVSTPSISMAENFANVLDKTPEQFPHHWINLTLIDELRKKSVPLRDEQVLVQKIRSADGKFLFVHLTSTYPILCGAIVLHGIYCLDETRITLSHMTQHFLDIKNIPVERMDLKDSILRTAETLNKRERFLIVHGQAALRYKAFCERKAP